MLRTWPKGTLLSHLPSWLWCPQDTPCHYGEQPWRDQNKKIMFHAVRWLGHPCHHAWHIHVALKLIWTENLSDKLLSLVSISVGLWLCLHGFEPCVKPMWVQSFCRMAPLVSALYGCLFVLYLTKKTVSCKPLRSLISEFYCLFIPVPSWSSC